MMMPVVEETAYGEPPGWLIRTVRNKYPILSMDGGSREEALETGYGHHEVVIETPRHDLELADFSQAHMTALIEMWHRRFEAALAIPGIMSVQLFRNRGSAAGASLSHAHSQIVALPLTPPRHSETLRRARAFHGETGGCSICAELARELEDGTRVVELADDFAVLVPFAARDPLEQWIIPRRHGPCFSRTHADERSSFGSVLQSAVRRLVSVAGETAYNLVLEPGSIRIEDTAAAHWSMRIVPHLNTPAGFELGSGMAANPSSPENDALRLREAKVPAPVSV